MNRCEWAGKTTIEQEYHDKEWGVPLHDDTKLFEFLILEGAQAGLSWVTILKKRDRYREVFDGFDPRKVVAYSESKIQDLLKDAGIIRNKLKIESAIKNARIFLDIQEQYGSFDHYIWQFVDGIPIQNSWEKMSDIPANTAISDKMSKELKRLGFKFVGTTICYAFMQAVGMVNDHVIDCFRYKEVKL